MTTTDAPVSAKARKFPCGACGADVVWSPGADALKCPYCGAEKKVPRSGDAVRERDVDSALREPRDLGWGAERKAVRCTKCGAMTTLDPGVAAGSCAFCGTPAVVEAPPDTKMVRPEGLLPFKVEKNSAVQKFREWIASLWFRPGDLKSKSSVTNIRGVYIPFWTFDAATYSSWTAEAGYYYYVDVEVIEDGKRVTRQEQRTRWEPASGFLEKFFDDVPVTASRGLEADLCREIEPYPTADLVPYTPDYLSGFLAEENAVPLEEALDSAKERMRREIEAECERQIPGDTNRNLDVHSTFSALAYKNALLPIWIAAYIYGGKSFRFLVNGVTGKVSGQAPISWIKVSLLILVIVAIIAIIVIAKGS